MAKNCRTADLPEMFVASFGIIREEFESTAAFEIDVVLERILCPNKKRRY